MRKIREIPLERARELFAYDPETGILRSRLTNKQVGYKYTNGYLQYRIDHHVYGVHRIAWALHYGENPAQQIDHINNDHADNRIENLRLADNSQNNSNKLLDKRNKSGVKGVFRVKWSDRVTKTSKWRVDVGHSGGRHYITHFDCFGQAVAHARQVRAELHGEFANNGYQPVGAL